MMFFRFRLIFFVLVVIGGLYTNYASATEDLHQAYWIWSSKKAKDHSACYFRKKIKLDQAPKTVNLFVVADDVAEIKINNQPKKPITVGLKVNKYELTKYFHKGENIFSIKVQNSAWLAGLICKLEIFTGDGKMVSIETDTSWKCSDGLSKGWEDLAFNDSSWKNAVLVSKAKNSPWRHLVNCSIFAVSAQSTLKKIPPANRGHIILDDFSDYSSWMGGPRRGVKRGHNVLPYQLGLGGGPDRSRNDGGSGMIDYDFIASDGLILMEKNAVYQNKAIPESIEFDANPQGYDCSIYFELMDRSDKKIFKTVPIKLSGKQWKRYKLKISPENIKDFDEIVFPISIRRLAFKGEKPGKGRVLIDDLRFVADLSNGKGQITVRSEYNGIAFKPNERVKLGFRIRNNWNRAVKDVVSLKVFDIDGHQVFSVRKTINVAAFDVKKVFFNAGSYSKKGPYRIDISVNNGKFNQGYVGWFGIFKPNGKRINKNTMWFGVEDQNLRNFRYEDKLHISWMKALGVDIIRGGAIGAQFGDVRGSKFGYEQYEKMFKPVLDAGIYIIFSYAGTVPWWTGHRLAAKEELFKEHIQDVAEFMGRNPGIKYFEWFNEPNLGFFHGTTDEYLRAQKMIYPIIKKYAPQVKVATGGVVIGHHDHAKKDFAERMYKENKDFYDIACYHGHEDYNSHLRNLATLDEWLSDAKISKSFGNSEAGARSYYSDPGMFRLQANELIKKITLTKSRNSDFYIWFMLQDYGDKYINADDSFGLINVDNQPKPSFVAYNELIRQLANTVPAKSLPLDSRITCYRFVRNNEEILVCWGSGQKFSFPLKSNNLIVYSDAFGNEKNISSQGGIIFVEAGAMPFYLRGPLNSISPVKSPVNLLHVPVFVPGESGILNFELTNPFPEGVAFSIKVAGMERKGLIPVRKNYKFNVPVHVKKDSVYGDENIGCSLTMNSSKRKTLFNGKINVQYHIALPIRTSRPVVIDINKPEMVRELMFAPNTPRWQGIPDCSGKIKISRNKTGLVFDAVINDDDHSVPGKKAYIWQNDCVQVGIANSKGQHYEFTVSGNKDASATVWSHIGPNIHGGSGVGWNVPAEVKRVDKKTMYHFEIPFDKLGLSGRKGEVFRIALLLCDNDKGRQLRFMEWNGGIQPMKDINLFGWAKFD